MAGTNNENSFALLVGVGQRAQDNEYMRISANDAAQIEKAVTTSLLLPEKNVVKKNNQDATRESVLAGLDNLIATTKVKQAELVIVYFSGHGCAIGDKYYLVCNDTKNEDIAGTSIEGTVFVGKLNEINTEKMIILLDCCHSQGIVATAPAVIPFEPKEVISRQNRVIITACASGQVSYLCDPVSLFTYALIEGLLGHGFNAGDTDIKIFQLALFTRERTATLSEQLLKPNPAQKMQLEVLPDSRTSNFIITTYPNGQRKKMPEGLAKLYRIGAAKEVIDTNADNTEDKDFRQDFNWLSNNNINIDGNGNITAIGTNITINASTSYDDLKELIKSQGEMIKQLMQQLAGTTEPKLKIVQDKIEVSEIETLQEEGTVGSLGKAIGLFMAKARTFPERTIHTALVILNGDYRILLEDKLNGLDVDQQRRRVQVRLATIINTHKLNLVS